CRSGGVMYQDATSTRQTPIIDPSLHPSSINTSQIRYITARIGPEIYYSRCEKEIKTEKKIKRNQCLRSDSTLQSTASTAELAFLISTPQTKTSLRTSNPATNVHRKLAMQK